MKEPSPAPSDPLIALADDPPVCYHTAMKQPRAYRYRCYPTSAQAAILAQTFGCTRFVYNWALRLRSDAYTERQERLSYQDTSAALTHLKRQPETVWLTEVASVPLQQALRHLDAAFRNFFARRTKYPAFHKKRGRQSATYVGNAFHYDAQTRTLMLAKIGVAAPHPLVASVTRGRSSHHCHPQPRCGWALLRQPSARRRDRAAAYYNRAGGA